MFEDCGLPWAVEGKALLAFSALPSCSSLLHPLGMACMQSCVSPFCCNHSLESFSVGCKNFRLTVYIAQASLKFGGNLLTACIRSVELRRSHKTQVISIHPLDGISHWHRQLGVPSYASSRSASYQASPNEH